MRSLYLLRPHGSAGIEGEQVVVRLRGEELDRVRLPLLDQILVMGNIQLTTPLVKACLRRGVPIAYLSGQGWCLGRAHPIDAGYRHRSRHQLDLSLADQLQAAISLIAGKVANGRVLLQRMTRRDRRELVAGSIERLGWHEQQVRQARSSERLRGLEGNAAQEYYQALGLLLEGDGFPFLGRHRRPPTTAFDALCGFGAGVLWNGLFTRVELRGLDPYVGVLHVGSARHPALISDLIEPLRTLLVDPLNVWLIRTRQLRADEDFEHRDGGVYLAERGRRVWLQAWATRMAEVVSMADGSQGPRWELVDGLVRNFVRFVYSPMEGLTVPRRR
ncbi:CRISPR-associated endonuclease Cas1 [Vulcanococcus limneticus]|uniref:CRISPR-associated endonuclease Cas1 n=1 Tax=Vulcanococcus limneticus TaxID=2170428 RepID=UPI00398C0CEA